MNTKTVLTLIAILIISLSGCERAQHVITPGTSTSDTMSTIKIGVIQPSGLAPNFTKGAELARAQVNKRRWSARNAGRIYRHGQSR